MDKVIFNVGGVNIEMDKETASKAIEAGESIELNSDELITYKKEDHEIFKTNLANEEYKKGKTAGEEMLIKTAKERNGLEFEGKSFDKYDEALKAKVIAEANIEPKEQITKLQGDLKTLQENYTGLEETHNNYKSNVEQEKTRFKKDSTLLGMIPDNLLVDKDIALLALKEKAKLDVDDNGIALINGQPKQNKLMENIPLSQDLISEHLTGLGLIKKKEGGSGGGDETGGKAGSYEKFVAEMEANGKNQGSEEFQLEMNKRIADKTLSDVNMKAQFEYKYNIGQSVYHATAESDRGLVIDVTYSLLTMQPSYNVAFGRLNEDSAWFCEHELSESKVFN